PGKGEAASGGTICPGHRVGRALEHAPGPSRHARWPLAARPSRGPSARMLPATLSGGQRAATGRLA
ncbi:MAG TPA: hypothetical protein VKA74_10860, partial [Myxococcota bacterium]|nr:hypothetical protein [Myxococcota bacterium]